MRFVERSRRILVQLMLVPDFVIRDIVEIQSCFFEPPMPTEGCLGMLNAS